MKKSIYRSDFCALDIETTGVNPFKDKIIEIGIVKFNLFNSSSSSYSTLIDPGIAVTPQAHKIHNISDSDLEGKPDYSSVYQNIAEFIDDSFLVIQNPQFDLSFLQIENRNNKKQFFSNYCFDTVILAKKIFKDLKNHKLETISRYLNCVRNFHRALDDAYCCRDVFIEGIKRLDQSKIFTISDLKPVCGFEVGEKVLKEIRHHNWKGVSLEPGNEFVINYRAKNGDITVRRVKTKGIIKNGSTLFLHAFCHLRNEERFFKLNRIKGIRSY